MTKVYLVQHVRSENEIEDTKIIGVFSNESNAKEAITVAKGLPGFCDLPESFSIDTYELDTSYWREGF